MIGEGWLVNNLVLKVRLLKEAFMKLSFVLQLSNAGSECVVSISKVSKTGNDVLFLVQTLVYERGNDP